MITAILCAAGNGSRAGFPQNKVLLTLNGLPVLCHSLSAFAQCPEVDEILIACRKEDEKAVLPLLRPFPNARTVRGGATRAQSVYYALNEAKGDIVLIHDAARPYVTPKLIMDCLASVKQYGSGVCAIPAVDTVAIADGGTIASSPARDTVFSLQTPQGFYRERLLECYEKAYEQDEEDSFTDDSGLYARYDSPPKLCAGDRRNKKLTYSEDFQFAERVGFGTDTHAFGRTQNFIKLAGVKIPSECGLIAHSDGDVLVHAVMDALLSAAGLRDIGYYFPDADEKYRNADSMLLLGQVVRLVEEQSFTPQNASVSILAETPRLSPYIEAMKRNLAKMLRLSPSAVGIAAGTNEKLGYIGEGKGITVFCTVLLKHTAAPSPTVCGI